uniref:Putative ovule protein n=1 Tax=Solanum chacoense TaxID=4108 RepID=A0A0V0H3S6_SOLCH
MISSHKTHTLKLKAEPDYHQGYHLIGAFMPNNSRGFLKNPKANLDFLRFVPYFCSNKNSKMRELEVGFEAGLSLYDMSCLNFIPRAYNKMETQSERGI